MATTVPIVVKIIKLSQSVNKASKKIDKTELIKQTTDQFSKSKIKKVMSGNVTNSVKCQYKGKYFFIDVGQNDFNNKTRQSIITITLKIKTW